MIVGIGEISMWRYTVAEPCDVRTDLGAFCHEAYAERTATSSHKPTVDDSASGEGVIGEGGGRRNK
jgi:hypothetical protein